MNQFTKTLIDKSICVSKAFNYFNVTNGLTFEHKTIIAPIALWMMKSFNFNETSKLDLQQADDLLSWMDQFVRDGSKIISISVSLAKSLLEANLPTDDKWNIETFGYAGLVEIGSNNYIFTNAENDENNEFVKSMLINEFSLNGKLLFKDDEPKELIKRLSYIFRKRPNGLIIEKKKQKLADVKRTARKMGKNVAEILPGTIYIIKEDSYLQSKYIKQLQEKTIQKNKNDIWKRQFRSWRRGHFRKQPIGLRSERQYELRWIMGHWMGSMNLPMKVQAAKIRYVDMPPQQLRYVKE